MAIFGGFFFVPLITYKRRLIMAKKPVVLLILDGYGLNDKVEGNAVAQAKTPVMDRLMKEYPSQVS